MHAENTLKLSPFQQLHFYQTSVVHLGCGVALSPLFQLLYFAYVVVRLSLLAA